MNLLETADNFYITGDFDKAEDLYQKILRDEPNNQWAYVNYSYALNNKGEFVKGIDLLEKFIDSTSEPDILVDILINLAMLYGKAGRVDESIDLFETILADGCHREELFSCYAERVGSDGMIDEAIDILKSGIKNCPNSSSLCNQLGSLYNDHVQDFNSAQKYFLMGLDISPMNPILNNNIGISFVATGKYHDAIDRFKKAIKESSNYIDAYRNLAVAYYHLDNYDDAAIALTKALDLSDNELEKSELMLMLSDLID